MMPSYIYNIKGSFNLVRNQIHRKINEPNSQMTIKIDRTITQSFYNTIQSE